MNTGDNEMMALSVAIDGDLEFELSLGELVGKHLRKRERAIRDQEAARLLPLGPDAVMDRLGVSRRSVYYMAERARKRSARDRATVAQN